MTARRSKDARPDDDTSFDGEMTVRSRRFRRYDGRWHVQMLDRTWRPASFARISFDLVVDTLDQLHDTETKAAELEAEVAALKPQPKPPAPALDRQLTLEEALACQPQLTS